MSTKNAYSQGLSATGCDEMAARLRPRSEITSRAVERGAPDTEGFSNPGFNDSAWPTTDVALQTWSSLGLHNHMGSMWYRTTIDVAQPQSGKTVWLWVGSTDGSVKAFVNGQAVQGGVVPRTGETFKPVDAPSSYGAPMRFDVTSVIRPGANAIALCEFGADEAVVPGADQKAVPFPGGQHDAFGRTSAHAGDLAWRERGRHLERGPVKRLRGGGPDDLDLAESRVREGVEEGA
jgi:hypothetical protein